MEGRAEEWYQLGKAAEKEGELTTAIQYYKRAERLGHSLTDPRPPTVWPSVHLEGERKNPHDHSVALIAMIRD